MCGRLRCFGHHDNSAAGPVQSVDQIEIAFAISLRDPVDAGVTGRIFLHGHACRFVQCYQLMIVVEDKVADTHRYLCDLLIICIAIVVILLRIRAL
jgi:hypothetical protein